MATKKALEKAYRAGHELMHVRWPDDMPEDARKLDERHCPFHEGVPEHAEERAAWMRGFLDALTGGLDESERQALVKRLDKEVAA